MLHEALRFNDFLAETRGNLDPEERVIFIYGGAPAHNSPENPAENTELKKLSPYSPFLNIVEQAISALKAAIKADISRPEIQQEMYTIGKKQEDKACHLVNIAPNCCWKHCTATLVRSRQQNVDSGIDLCKHTPRAQWIGSI